MKIPHRILFLLLMIMLAIPAVQAQEATEEPDQPPASNVLQYGVPVEGAITAEALTQTWRLENVAADRIDVRVERLTGTLSPDISILDVSGQFLQSSYGSDATRAVALIEDYYIPTAGTFQILVGREGGATGATTGTYRLTVTPRALADTTPPNSEVIGVIEYDTPIEGEITAEHWQHLYTLSADAPHWVLITVERTDGSLVPYWEIRNSSGDSVATGYTNYDLGQARADIQLPSSGDYTLVVSRDRGFQGDTTGQYRATVKILGAGEGSALLISSAPEPLAYDIPDEGEITGEQWYRDYTLTVEAPDVIRLYVERVEGTLLAEIGLLDSAGTEIQHAYIDSTGAFAESFYEFSEAGTYTVRVIRSNAQNGGTTGNYRLLVELLGSGAGSPNLAPTSGAIISADKPVTGTLTNTRWMDTWTLEAQAGQVFDISVERTEGTLIPHIVILDEAGNYVTDISADETYAIARNETFSVPAAGTYQVIVERRDAARGLTIGSYTLSLKPVTQ